MDETRVRDLESSSQDLFTYKGVELRCATDLRRLRDTAAKLELNESTLELTDNVLRRVENKRFSIAVVGEFKRGKSTFINALLGREILPADILPCSATLNRVTYGLKPSVSIYYKKDGDTPQRVEEIGIDQLEDYVTKLTPESEQNASQIEEAVTRYPSEYCRNNVDIIDTPGLNDDETMTAVTMSVIPKVDAAIFLIMPEAPFTVSEGDFLTNHLLLQDLGRVMFVVTAVDRMRRDKDRDRIVQVVQDRIAKAVDARLKEQFEPGSEDFQLYRQKIGIPKVFPLSAFQALEAVEGNDDQLLEESRFPKFTTALESFLTHTRGAIELQVLTNRIIATGEEIIKKINTELGALEMAQKEFDEAYELTLTTLESLRRRREEEIGKIGDAATRTKQRLEPMIEHLGHDLKKAAASVIDNASVTTADIKKDRLPELTKRLGKQVSDAVSQSARRAGEKLQIEIERDLQVEIDRLYDFATTVRETLHGIEVRFGTVNADASAKRSSGAESLAAAVSVVTGFGGIWSGYQEAGLKGAAVGGVASVGTAIVGPHIAALAGLTTLSLPVILVIGAASFLTGGFAAQRLFGADRVERFKDNYRSAVLERLDEKLQEEHLDRKVTEKVHELYDALKDKLIGELTASIDQTQSTLDNLRDRKSQDETLSERKRQESEEIRDEVQAIRAKALRLSYQLQLTTEVASRVSNTFGFSRALRSYPTIGDQGTYLDGGSEQAPLRNRPAESRPARHVNVWLESEPPLIVDLWQRLGVDIDALREQALVGQPFAEPDWGDRREIELSLSLVGEGAQIEPSPQRVVLCRSGTMKPLYFRIRPLRTGELDLYLSIYLYREMTLLMRLELSLDVERGEEKPE